MNEITEEDAVSDVGSDCSGSLNSPFSPNEEYDDPLTEAGMLTPMVPSSSRTELNLKPAFRPEEQDPSQTSGQKQSAVAAALAHAAGATPAMIFSLYLENLLKSFSLAANIPHRDVLEKAVGVDTK